MKPVVFLGPSLPIGEARAILDAVYLPPVSMGDIFRLMGRGPTVIGIIDGLFEQTPAVWHKEILFALSRGVRVLGASSMGALRAAELVAFGMEGVGEVFAAFQDGTLEDDDEVAVAHAPAADGFRCLSDAMVSIRAGLREARASGAIGGRTHDRLVAAAKGLYYPDRSWPRLFQLAGALEIPAAELAALRERISRARPDVKRADAIQLLRRLAADGAPDVATPPPPGSLPFDFEPTWYWEQLILHEGSVGEADDSTSTASAAVSAAALRRHVRLHATRARDPLGAALLLYLADEQAARRGILDAAPTPAPAPIWAGGAPDPLLSAADRASLARGRAAVAALLREAGDQVNRRLAAALAHIGRLEPTVAEVRRKQAALRSLGLRSASPADAGVTLEELLSWYQRRFGPIDAESPEAHAAEAGFTSFEEFVGELVVEYLVERGAGIGPGR